MSGVYIPHIFLPASRQVPGKLYPEHHSQRDVMCQSSCDFLRKSLARILIGFPSNNVIPEACFIWGYISSGIARRIVNLLNDRSGRIWSGIKQNCCEASAVAERGNINYYATHQSECVACTRVARCRHGGMWVRFTSIIWLQALEVCKNLTAVAILDPA